MTVTVLAQVTEADRTRTARGTAGTATAPAAMPTRAPATDVMAVPVMADTAGRATARAVRETTSATAAALVTRAPMAGPAVPGMALNLHLSIMTTWTTTRRRARPGPTVG